ncbi:hypothetical protein ACVWYN_002203 [Pedobacter sp. UYP24]
MNKIKQDYLTAFERLARSKLEHNGYVFKFLPEEVESSSGFRILISKNGDEYLLFFSTHHLDLSDGVMVCKTDDRKIHYDRIVLPSLPLNKNQDFRYGYSDDEIERITADICAL